MPILTTSVKRSPFGRGDGAGADPVGETRACAERRVDLGHDVLAVDADRAGWTRLRSATCSTARFSVMLMGSPANIAVALARDVGGARQRLEQHHRLVRHRAFRPVEQEIVERAAE